MYLKKKWKNIVGTNRRWFIFKMKTVFCCLFFSSFGHAMYLFCLLDIVDRDMEDIFVCIYALCPTVALFRQPSMYYFYAFHKCSKHTKKQNHNLHFRFDCLYRFCNIIYKYDSNFFVFQICWANMLAILDWKNADEFIIHWDFDSDRFPGFSNTLHYS